MGVSPPDTPLSSSWVGRVTLLTLTFGSRGLISFESQYPSLSVSFLLGSVLACNSRESVQPSPSESIEAKLPLLVSTELHEHTTARIRNRQQIKATHFRHKMFLLRFLNYTIQILTYQ